MTQQKKKPCNCSKKHKFIPLKDGRFENYNFKSLGLGDTVYKLIGYASLGMVKSCKACSRRRNVLNRMFPYRG